ncbi:Kae1-associated serine/threonine protein kinase [Candidatus Woesearchaeota archaeon]|nr:Kae1-associated serine/threonine protein kinase [Candidatus Woesearchaeota archaeon]
MEIDKGAEATIRLHEKQIIKDRQRKSYRLSEIDERLRKFRTRREAKVLNKLEEINFPAPKLHAMCDRAMQIRMELVQGNKLRDILYKDPLNLGRELGRKIGILHANNIIHGDLTTSNMILDKEIRLIDFGLSFFSQKEEDKAVDLHLLRQALESKHHKVWEDCFREALEGYKETNPEHELILNRLTKVESRGRHKNKSL